MCLKNCKKEKLEDYYLQIEDWSQSDTYSQWNDRCDYVEIEECIKTEKSNEDLCILQCNTRGAINKQLEISDLLGNCNDQNCVDIAILVETWLTKESENRFLIPGYTYVGATRKHKKGGGVGFLCTVPFTVQPFAYTSCTSRLRASQGSHRMGDQWYQL